MKTVTIILLSVILSLGSWSLCGAAGEQNQHLFHIERSKNKNIVQYDAVVLPNGNLRDKNPVIVYWILENGQKEQLNSVERTHAYGIDSQDRLGKNKFRIDLIALEDRKITVEKLEGKYKCIVDINGKPSILEKVYIDAKDRMLWFPKVLYIDLFGYDLQTKASVQERITPEE